MVKATDLFKHLTQKDMEYLLSWGHEPRDFKQIDEAIDVTKYEYEEKRISKKKAIELLGRKVWLSGISRSAFHWTAARSVDGDDKCVFFDSSKLFK